MPHEYITFEMWFFEAGEGLKEPCLMHVFYTKDGVKISLQPLSDFAGLTKE